MSDTSVTLKINGMSCASCVGRVDKTLREVAGIRDVSVNLASGTARISAIDPQAARHAQEAVTQAGYPAQPHISGETATEASDLKQAVIIACLLALPVFILEMGGHLIPAVRSWIDVTIGQQVSRLIQFALTTMLVLGPGRVFFTKGARAFVRRAPDMNALVALGAGAAYCFSVLATFAPNILPEGARHVYFESAALIISLILLGRYLEARAKTRTGAAIAKLSKLQPTHAYVLRNGVFTELPADQIAQGDHVQIKPGAKIPCDGRVISGASHVDEAMLTGEPFPRDKEPGDTVTGGTINGTGALVIEAISVGADTVLAQIIAMVEQAQSAKLPVQDLVNRITAVFVPVVLVIALATIASWLIFGPAPVLTHALVAGVAVLIIACPCAMGLATPSAIMVGTGRAAELGVLFAKGEALQTLQSVGVVALDKTGTITRGRPEVVAMTVLDGFDEDEVLRLTATLEVKSEHPIGQAIVNAAGLKGLPEVSEFSSETGFGLRGVVDGRQVIIGTARLLQAEGILPDALEVQAQAWSEDGYTPVYVGIDAKLAGAIAIGDVPKTEATETVAKLKSMGLQVAMISGDTAATTQAIASRVGIEQVVAEVLPAQKVVAVKNLRDDFGRVVFVGDGINDAPVLAEADVGIAIGTGTDIAIEAADVVLMSGDLSGLTSAIEISQRTMRTIRQNLFWAFAYNVLLIPVAAGVLFPIIGVLLSPALAAAAMALSSVFVLSNALRLRYAIPNRTRPA